MSGKGWLRFLSNHPTIFQSQPLSVGFVVSGLLPRHAGFRAVLRVPRDPWGAENHPVSVPFRFRSALCSQKILENRADLAHAERVSGQRVTRVSVRGVRCSNWCSSEGRAAACRLCHQDRGDCKCRGRKAHGSKCFDCSAKPDRNAGQYSVHPDDTDFATIDRSQGPMPYLSSYLTDPSVLIGFRAINRSLGSGVVTAVVRKDSGGDYVRIRFDDNGLTLEFGADISCLGRVAVARRSGDDLRTVGGATRQLRIDAVDVRPTSGTRCDRLFSRVGMHGA